MYKISKEFQDIQGAVSISGSKSESNRLILLRAYTSYFKIFNLSDSDDTQLMLSAIESDKKEINIGHAGTAMRFLTSYYSSISKNSKILTGSNRMKQRPISILVDALKHLGCDIEYVEKNGFPPLKINGKNILSNSITLPADISSQYISSLMMLGVSLENGLNIKLSSEITSLPYILMTKKIIDRIGGITKIDDGEITIEPFKEKVISLVDELDPLAKQSRAVNTIVNNNGYLIGYNTDVLGIKNCLKPIKIQKNKKILLLGAGGAARAILVALKNLKYKNILLSNRTSKKGKQVAKEFDIEFIKWSKRSNVDAVIIINATSIGMSPNTELVPISQKSIIRAKLIIDIVVKPANTKLIKIANSEKISTIDGTQMALNQAYEQFNLYTGKKAPKDIMQRALKKIMNEK